MSESKFVIAEQLSGAFDQTQFKIKSASQYVLNLKPNESLTTDRILNLITGDADRTLTLLGNPTLADWFDQSVKEAASPTFAALNTSGAISSGVAGSSIGRYNLSGNTSGTISILPQAAAGTYNFNLPTSAGSSGQALLSGGGGSSPMTFGTLGVGGGGTGITTATPYSIICAGTTGAGAFQSLSSLGSSGQVLTSNGAGALPSWQSISGGSAATQAEQEAATSTTVFVSPGRQQFHPSAAKAWVNFNGTGTVSIRSSYGVTSITDNGTGDYTINTAVTFSSTNNMAANVSVGGSGAWVGTLSSTPFTTTSVRVFSFAVDTSFQDVSFVCVSIFGDLA